MIYSYNFASESAKLLSEATGFKRIKPEGSKFKGSKNKFVINWGSSEVPEEVEKCMIINPPNAVKIASNKLKFFYHVKDKVSIPDFTKDIEEAKQWVDEGNIVFGRKTLTGHSGEGIFILEEPKDFEAAPICPVYTRYIPKKDEYRVHIVDDEVIDVRRKAIRQGVNAKAVNFKVRSYNNGFIFVKNDVNPPQQVIEEALKAVKVCGLHFGAVDVIFNNFRDKAYVLEVNTAPGLEGSSVETYAEAFKKFLKDEKFVDKVKGIHEKFLEAIDAVAALQQKKAAIKFNIEPVEFLPIPNEILVDDLDNNEYLPI